MNVNCPPCKGTGFLEQLPNGITPKCQLCKGVGKLDNETFRRLFRQGQGTEVAPETKEPVSAGTWVACGVIAFVLFVGLIGSLNPSSGKTDGVYESAVEKMDKGIPLNEREKQRINSVLDLDRKKESEAIERKHGQR